jgi:serine/threonine protein phosphatase 1
MRLGEARTPPGMRLYAIGDIHGCDRELGEMHDKIGADLAARPASDHRIIHVGDYADRGPNSAAVIEQLVKMTAADQRVVCLKGNHDQMLADFLADASAGGIFLANGGGETLASYGVPPSRFPLWPNLAALRSDLRERMPATHRSFIEGLPLSVRFGDYFFCHAGIRPGVPLDRQAPEDLIWIRDSFLTDDSDHGVVVVHGHTPVPVPEVRSNRINIDTGLVYGGSLTCLVLEGTDYRFL